MGGQRRLTDINNPKPHNITDPKWEYEGIKGDGVKPAAVGMHKGACIIVAGAQGVYEEYERAKARGAKIYAEILGYGTNCDGFHLTNPDDEGMAGAMIAALDDASLYADDIEHVNAHATSTEAGDIAESKATHSLFKERVPVSAFKGYMGHTLGAAGAIESIITILMMKEGFIAPTKNLKEPDPECAPLNHVIGDARDHSVNIAMNNNFAFGGINTSLIYKKI